jgi:hypothetical protein
MRKRMVFGGARTMRLELEFATNRYVSKPLRAKLAEELTLSQYQIKIWFQNRRVKSKR